MNIAITGVTGLLGRNLFYEIIRYHYHELENLRFFLLGRSSAKVSFKERVKANFLIDGFSYLRKPADEQPLHHFLEENVHYVEMDLESENLFPEVTDRDLLRSTEIDYFFHLAALPDLRSLPSTEEKVMRLNYEATRYLVQFLLDCSVKEFAYVGTAFVCGKKTGLLSPDDLNEEKAFNNPYERSKMLAELTVREFSMKSDTRCRYFRPGIVCGRLIEPPVGQIHKFDVFYQIFSFFLFLKALKLGTLEGLMDAEMDLDLRAVFNPESSGNIVPVDYLVKVMYEVCQQGAPDDSFHLVNEQNVFFADFLDAAMEEMKISGVHSVRSIPDAPHIFEQMYYDRIGNLFDAYLNTEPRIFDTSNLQPVLQKAGLECPKIDRENVKKLIRFALQQHFGLDLPKLLKQFGGG